MSEKGAEREMSCWQADDLDILALTQQIGAELEVRSRRTSSSSSLLGKCLQRIQEKYQKGTKSYGDSVTWLGKTGVAHPFALN